MTRPRYSAKANKGSKNNDKKGKNKKASPKSATKSGKLQRTGFKDMPPELLLLVYKTTEDLVDKLALVKACSPSILDGEWQTHGITHLKNQMATITDDSQLIRFLEMSRFLDADNVPTTNNSSPNGAAVSEDLAMYTLRSSVLWPRALHNMIIEINDAENVKAVTQSGWFFRPFEHAGDVWQEQLRKWLERILLQEVCGTRRPSLERLEKMLWGRSWENGIRKNGEFIGINMNVEDVGSPISLSFPGNRHEKLFLTVEELIPLLRNILLVWCSTPKKEAPWDKVRVLPMVRDYDGNFWEVGELIPSGSVGLGVDKKMSGQTKALIERLKNISHKEVLSKLAKDGLELGEGWGGDVADGNPTNGNLTFGVTEMVNGEGEKTDGDDFEIEETEEEADARKQHRHAALMAQLRIRRPGEHNPYAHEGYEDEGDEEFETRMEEGEAKLLEEWDDEKFWEKKREAWGLDYEDE